MLNVLQGTELRKFRELEEARPAAVQGRGSGCGQRESRRAGHTGRALGVLGFLGEAVPEMIMNDGVFKLYSQGFKG